MNSISFIKYVLTEKDASFIKDLASYFRKINAKVRQDYQLQGEAIVFITVMDNSKNNVKRILELYDRDFLGLNDSQLRELLGLRNPKDAGYSQSAVIGRALDFEEARVLRVLKQSFAEDFHEKFIGYAISEMNDRRN